MRHVERPLSSYEAYCFNCEVTFPSETRRCLHCGARVVPPSRKRVGESIEQMTKQFAEAARRREQTSGFADAGASMRRTAIEELVKAEAIAGAPGAVLPNDGVDEIRPARRASPLTMIWILLAFTGAAIRACSGG